MRKIILCLVLTLGVSLVGCKSNTEKQVNVENKPKVEEKVDAIKESSANIGKLNELINEKKYDEAKDLIVKLGSEKLDQQNKAEFDKLKAKLDADMSSSKKKKEYKDKLDKIEESLKYLKDPKYSATTQDMRKAAGETYKKWDDALNEIYGVLKSQLSADEMKSLQTEETKWISDRDNKAKEDSAKVKGGTLEPVEHTYSLANSTKIRCYELVEKYMK